MTDAIEHSKVVLAAILAGRTDLLSKAQAHLVPAHFPDQVLSNLYTLVERYAAVTGAVLTASALQDLLRSADPGRAALYTETYNALVQRRVEDSAFVWSIQQLRELAAERSTVQALTEGMEILRSGRKDPRGEWVKGHEPARHHVLSAFATIDRELSMQDAPEGDMRQEATDILGDYAERKRLSAQGRSGGIMVGVSELDYKIGGVQPGELALVAGYSSDGKTSICTQMAWSAAVEQGRNVVFLTTETLRPQVRRKIVARHSKLPQFGLPDGLNTRDLKFGTLTSDQEASLQEVVSDFTRNPTYGRLMIAQVPRGATIGTCETRLHRYERDFQVDLVVMDYLALLRSERRRQSDREELGAILREAKVLATTFGDGRGVPFVSPWQVNRSSRDNAVKAGYYTTSALAETAESTNSADVVVSILAPETDDRYCEVKFQVLKNRDGETASSISVDVDYATSWFGSKRREGGMEELLEGPTANGSEYAGLLG